jgi:hypothetical protein
MGQNVVSNRRKAREARGIVKSRGKVCLPTLTCASCGQPFEPVTRGRQYACYTITTCPACRMATHRQTRGFEEFVALSLFFAAHHAALVDERTQAFQASEGWAWWSALVREELPSIKN